MSTICFDKSFFLIIVVIAVAIILYNHYNNYVYDFETENHHFMAGNGNIVVHNTDSIFSCYRFREDVKQIKDTSALPLWKDIISFSKRLLNYFLPDEYKQLWNEYHNKYYSENREKILPKKKEWQNNNKDKINTEAKREYQKTI
jgi:hypothetical protein